MALGTSSTSEQCEQYSRLEQLEAAGSAVGDLGRIWSRQSRVPPSFGASPVANPCRAKPGRLQGRHGAPDPWRSVSLCAFASHHEALLLTRCCCRCPCPSHPCRCGGQPAVNPRPGTDCQTQHREKAPPEPEPEPSPSARIYLESARWSDAGSRTVDSGFWLVLVALGPA